MAKLADKVRGALKSAFPTAQIFLNLPATPGSITGEIIWSGFSRLDQLDRHLRVDRVLKGILSQPEFRKVTLFTSSPREWKFHQANRLEEEERILRTAANIRRDRLRHKKELQLQES